MMKYLWIMIFILLINIAYAAIYMQKETNGVTTYSDAPLGKNATIIPSPNINENTTTSVVTTPETKPLSPSTSAPNMKQPTQTASPDTRKPYIHFILISPKNQETIQNQASFTVTLNIEPPLQEGDTVQVLLDGKSWGQPVHDSHITMSEIDRGQHEIYAVLLDRDQKIIKQSNPITIFVQRIGTNFPARTEVTTPSTPLKLPSVFSLRLPSLTLRKDGQ